MPRQTVARAGPSIAIIAVITASVVAVHWTTVKSMAGIWNNSETYKHGWVVFPIAAWLAWRERAAFDAGLVRPWWPALALSAITGFLWMLGHLASVATVEHLAIVLTIQLAIAGALGPELSRRFWFPILFLLFQVPIGEELVPSLMDRTADFVVATLRISGVPVYREGNFFNIPTGSWSVVEACSGIRYLLVSLMAGTLYAFLTYRSAWRRWVFVGVSLVVPIVANWLRAYMIVMLGHFSNNTIAVGVDHLIYGAIFFGIIMAILFWVGSLWREDVGEAAKSAKADAGVSLSSNIGSLRPRIVFAFAVVAVAASWPAFTRLLEARSIDDAPSLGALSQVEGWRVSDEPLSTWAPRFVGQRAELRQTFVRGAVAVELFVAYYRGQEPGRELVSYENTVITTSDEKWRQLARGSLRFDPSGIDAASTTIAGSGRRLLIAKWYRIGDAYTASDAMAKARLALQMLLGRGDDGAAIVVWTDDVEDDDRARRTLQEFVRSVEPSLDQRFRRMQSSR